MASKKQMVSKSSLAILVPCMASRLVGIRKGNEMINVEVGWVFRHFTGVGIGPTSRCDAALATVSESDVTQRLLYQDFLPCILAITVRVGPMIPIVAVIGWKFRWRL